MGTLTDTFLRNRGRAGDRMETLQEKAARSVVQHLADGQELEHPLPGMLDRARARSWARESVNSQYAEQAEDAANQYWRTTARLGRKIRRGPAEEVQNEVEHMRYLTDPETLRVFRGVKPFVEHPDRLFEDYRTRQEREFEEDGRSTDLSFRKWERDRLGVGVRGTTRNERIVGVMQHFGVSRTAAIAILADLVEEFERIYDRPALLT